MDNDSNLLKQLLQVSQDVIYSIAVDDGLILSLSSTFTKLTGWPISDWIGRPFYEIIWPEDRPIAQKAFGDQVLGQDIRSCELRILTKSKRLLIGDFASSLVHKHGKPFKVIGIARDVTKRKIIEEELDRRNRQVVHILDSIADGFYMLDNDWKYIMVNRTVERVLGKNPGELIGREIWRDYGPGIQVVYKDKFTEAKRTGKPAVFEQLLSPNQWFEIRAYPHSDGLAVYFTDIAVRKRAEEQLKKHSEGVEKILDDIIGIQEKWGS